MFKTVSKFLLLTILFSMFCFAQSQAQEGSVAVNQDRDIAVLLALKKDINKTKMNYKIQIFSRANDRLGAEKARLDFSESFTDMETSLKYETPNYKIWVGNFKTRLEVDRALLEIKKKFPNAFPIKPKKER